MKNHQADELIKKYTKFKYKRMADEINEINAPDRLRRAETVLKHRTSKQKCYIIMLSIIRKCYMR